MIHWCRPCGRPARFCLNGAWWCEIHVHRFDAVRLAKVETLLRHPDPRRIFAHPTGRAA